MATAPTEVPGAVPSVTAIIVNYRTPDLAIDCLASLDAARTEAPGLRAIAVDGGSGDGSDRAIAGAIAARGWGDWAEGLPLALNGGFGYANNQAMLTALARPDAPDFFLLVNPDARVRPGAVAAMLDLMAREPKAGAVGGLLIHDDGSTQGSAFQFPSVAGEFFRGLRIDALRRLAGLPPTTIQADRAVPAPWVTGAAVMLRTAALRRTGLFDDGFFLYFEETELMARLARDGWSIWHEPAAKIVHLGGKATNIRDAETGAMLVKRLPRYWYEARRRYFARTGGPARVIAADLAYLAGRGLGRLRCLVQRKADDQPPRSARDVAALGLPSAAERRPAIVPADAAPGGRPAWMDR